MALGLLSSREQYNFFLKIIDEMKIEFEISRQSAILSLSYKISLTIMNLIVTVLFSAKCDLDCHINTFLIKG